LHTCDMCEFSTKAKTSLDSHKDSMHKGIKRYNCDQCDYSSAWSTNVIKQINTRSVFTAISD